jgi:hypothetical protein
MKQYPTDEEVRMQFVLALDAWGKIERAMMTLFYIFLKPLDFSIAATVYHSINSFQSQREAISALSLTILKDAIIRQSVEALMDRVRRLATKRNRIIHGRWRHMERRGRRILFRVYFHQNMSLWAPKSFREAKAMKGNTHFDDIIRCEREFMALATDITSAFTPVASDRNVSPYIEIPIEQVTGLKIQTNPP